MSKRINKTPQEEPINKSWHEKVKEFVINLVITLCYVAIGSVIIIYIMHFILPDVNSTSYFKAWLLKEQLDRITNLLSGGFVFYLIGKIQDKL